MDMISLAQWHALLSEVGALSNPVVCPSMAMLLRQGLAGAWRVGLGVNVIPA